MRLRFEDHSGPLSLAQQILLEISIGHLFHILYAASFSNMFEVRYKPPLCLDIQTTSNSTNVKPLLFFLFRSNMLLLLPLNRWGYHTTNVFTDRIPIRIPMMIIAMIPPIPRISAGSSSVSARFTSSSTSDS